MTIFAKIFLVKFYNLISNKGNFSFVQISISKGLLKQIFESKWFLSAQYRIEQI